MTKPDRIYIPAVTFFGKIYGQDGKPITGEAALYPQCDTRAFEVGEYLFGMKNYHFPITRGEFIIDVLPSDFGVDRPYTYIFETPERIWRLYLHQGAPHDFNKMLAGAE